MITKFTMARLFSPLTVYQFNNNQPVSLSVCCVEKEEEELAAN